SPAANPRGSARHTHPEQNHKRHTFSPSGCCAETEIPLRKACCLPTVTRAVKDLRWPNFALRTRPKSHSPAATPARRSSGPAQFFLPALQVLRRRPHPRPCIPLLQRSHRSPARTRFSPPARSVSASRPARARALRRQSTGFSSKRPLENFISNDSRPVTGCQPTRFGRYESSVRPIDGPLRGGPKNSDRYCRINVCELVMREGGARRGLLRLICSSKEAGSSKPTSTPDQWLEWESSLRRLRPRKLACGIGRQKSRRGQSPCRANALRRSPRLLPGSRRAPSRR